AGQDPVELGVDPAVELAADLVEADIDEGKLPVVLGVLVPVGKETIFDRPVDRNAGVEIHEIDILQEYIFGIVLELDADALLPPGPIGAIEAHVLEKITIRIADIDAALDLPADEILQMRDLVVPLVGATPQQLERHLRVQHLVALEALDRRPPGFDLVAQAGDQRVRE